VGRTSKISPSTIGDSSCRHLTLRGSGRSKAAGAKLEVACRRCTSPLGRISDPLIGPGAAIGELALGWSAAIVAGLAQAVWIVVVAPSWSVLQMIIAVLFAFDIGGGVVVNATSSARNWWHRPGQGLPQHIVFFAAHLHPFVVAWLWLSFGWLEAGALYLTMVAMAVTVLMSPARLARPLAFGLGAVGIVLGMTVLRMPVGLEWLPALYYVKLVMAHAVRD